MQCWKHTTNGAGWNLLRLCWKLLEPRFVQCNCDANNWRRMKRATLLQIYIDKPSGHDKMKKIFYLQNTLNKIPSSTFCFCGKTTFPVSMIMICYYIYTYTYPSVLIENYLSIFISLIFPACVPASALLCCIGCRCWIKFESNYFLVSLKHFLFTPPKSYHPFLLAASILPFLSKTVCIVRYLRCLLICFHLTPSLSPLEGDFLSQIYISHHPLPPLRVSCDLWFVTSPNRLLIWFVSLSFSFYTHAWTE